MPGYTPIAGQNTANIRKAVNGGVHIALASADALDRATLFDVTTGALQALPTGYSALGLLTTDGAKIAKGVTTSEIASWQSAVSTRVDITKTTVTVTFECQETNLQTLALFLGVDPATISTTPDASGSIEMAEGIDSNYYRVAIFGVDLTNGEETVVCRFLPRARVTDYHDQTFANGDSPITYGFTLTAFLDDTLGYSSDLFVGGEGWKAALTDTGFTAGV